MDYKTQLLEIEAFKRFPSLIPHVSENYNNGKYRKLFLVWESYYDTQDKGKEYYENREKWYNLNGSCSNDEMHELWKKNDWRKYWNFECKIDKNGCNKNGATFLNPERELKKFSDEKDSYSFCTGYNYFLRPASPKQTGKQQRFIFTPKKEDHEYAFNAFCKIIEVIKPELIVFFSSKARDSFKKQKKKNNSKFSDIRIKYFQHPSSPWWHRKECPQGLAIFLQNNNWIIEQQGDEQVSIN